MVYIYILKCTQNKYYVGKTTNPEFRLKSHCNANGSAWTKKYPPTKLVDIFKGDDYDEDKYTKKYMDKYGIDNVRGGSYVSVKLDESTIEHLTKMSNGTNDKCFKCGEAGHFARYCNKESELGENIIEEYDYAWACDYCGKEFDTKKGAMFHQNVHCKKKTTSSKKKTTATYYYEESEESEESDCDDYEYNTSKKCYKCGRKGHYSNNCYASKHVKGYYIS